MSSLSLPPEQRWLARTQNAAIFAVCANLFSTALGNVGFAAFLLLFAWMCADATRRAALAWDNFPRAVALAMLVYIGWQAVGLTYTDAPMDWALRSIYSERKILYVLPLTLVFAQEAPRRRFLIAFVAVCGVALVLSSLLAVQWTQKLVAHDPTKVLHSHATQSMAFAMSCFAALWFSTQAATARSRFLWLALSAAFMLNVLAVTVGRSGYVAFLVFVVVAFAARRGARGVVIGVVAAGLVGLLAFYGSSSVQKRVLMGVHEARDYQSAPDETSLGRRLLLYTVTADLIRERPVLGGGTGSFMHRFSSTVSSRYQDWKARPFDDPHNQYLFCWVENGIIGLATFLFMLWTLYSNCDRRHAYGLMATGCLLAWCATSLFSGHFRTFPEGHLIAFVLGILMAPLRPEREAAPVREPEGVPA